MSAAPDDFWRAAVDDAISDERLRWVNTLLDMEVLVGFSDECRKGMRIAIDLIRKASPASTRPPEASTKAKNVDTSPPPRARPEDFAELERVNAKVQAIGAETAALAKELGLSTSLRAAQLEADGTKAELAQRVAELEVALLGMVLKWGPHSGSCCVFLDDRVVVTTASCVCGPEEKAARAALARLDGSGGGGT